MHDINIFETDTISELKLHWTYYGQNVYKLSPGQIYT
jgi:hypothetical protein